MIPKNDGEAANRRPSAAPAATAGPGPILSDPQHAAVDLPAVETGNGGPAFMAFHVDGGESFAVTGEDVPCDVDRPDDAIFGEECTDAVLGRRPRKAANE